MTRSTLATEIHSTRQKSSRSKTITHIITHHAASTNADAVVNMMVNETREVSAHAVVKDDRIISIVEEEYRAWSLGDESWDSRALVVETINSSLAPKWEISDKTYRSLARLYADWCTRYGIAPHRSGNLRNWNFISHREVNEIHRGSYATACPGGINMNRLLRETLEEINNKGDWLDMATQDEVRAIVREEINSATRVMLDGVRRDARARLYRNTATNEIIGVDWRKNVGEPGRVLYAHGGEKQAFRWFSPRQWVGDSPKQAILLDAEMFESVKRAAEKGEDTAFFADGKIPE